MAVTQQHRSSEGTKWFDVKQAAAHVRFCEKTIWRACATGGLQHVRVGRRIRIRPAWLDTWMLDQSIRPPRRNP